ncbi:MAG: hypothetical protein E5X48_06910 [Mesorhizobium sp.]|uniref:CocE/NonD family hydrolase C-terminal non-catalytic domain-containing protein n=1 Tax=Mesorhizobium sp. TaxID=1871066 RepID=UPI00121491F1|nr:MAG: hypothetical protein E5X48_06910 [Mesorhizobium sp.]
MKPGETVAVEMVLDACGYRFAPGHRLRLPFSSAYWPRCNWNYPCLVGIAGSKCRNRPIPTRCPAMTS